MLFILGLPIGTSTVESGKVVSSSKHARLILTTVTFVFAFYFKYRSIIKDNKSIIKGIIIFVSDTGVLIVS